MNHLAHALLGGETADLLLGSVLGDFVHGPVPTQLRREVQIGIRLHRAIDVYTDAHPILQAARAAFVPPYRRYAGIILDVWFDHLLARDFTRWHAGVLDEFSANFLLVLAAHREELPPPLRGYLAYLQREGLPAAYREREVVARALAGIGTRLSRPNPLASALMAIEPVEQLLQSRFEEFFPQLQEFAKVRLFQLRDIPEPIRGNRET